MAPFRKKNVTQKWASVPFSFNHLTLLGIEGEPIAAALMANGIRTIRHCEITDQPRGIFCGIGHCYECRAEVNGIPNVRTCLTPLEANTVVQSRPSWLGGNEDEH